MRGLCWWMIPMFRNISYVCFLNSGRTRRDTTLSGAIPQGSFKSYKSGRVKVQKHSSCWPASPTSCSWLPLTASRLSSHTHFSPLLHLKRGKACLCHLQSHTHTHTGNRNIKGANPSPLFSYTMYAGAGAGRA